MSMYNIKLSRVDDRLIHGQVMTAWLQYTSAKRIVIIDDQTAADEFTRTIISMACPSHIELEILGVDDGAQYIKGSDDTPTILLAKNPAAFLQLVERGVELDEVIVGGMGANKDRSKLYKNIAASEKEREIFKELIARDIVVKIQVIPDHKAVLINEYL